MASWRWGWAAEPKWVAMLKEMRGKEEVVAVRGNMFMLIVLVEAYSKSQFPFLIPS